MSFHIMATVLLQKNITTMKRLSLPLLLLMALCAIASASGIKAPAFLKPGDKIAIISPASAISARGADSTYAVLQRWGFTPIMGTNICNRYHGFAGTVDERKADLVKALTDTTVKAIFCTRGGYGSLQILNKTNLQVFRNNPKWIIGYSDITALHSAEVRAGNMSIHANMAGPLGYDGGNDTTCRALHNLLLGKLPSYRIPAHKFNHEGTARGILVGGNMSVYGGLAESDYDFLTRDFLKTHDVVLFIEDVGERYDSVDRMLHLLKIRGVLSHIKGLIVGKFTEYKAVKGYDDMYDMIHRYIADLNIPVCYNFPAGHIGHQNFPMIEGCPVTLNVAADGVTLNFDINGKQK